MNKLFSTLRLAPKLGLMIGIPLLALLIIAGRTVIDAKSQAGAAENMSEIFGVAQQAATLMASISLEKKASRVFLDSRGKKGADELDGARKQTNTSLESYSNDVASLSKSARSILFNKRIVAVDEALAGLTKIREKVVLKKTKTSKARKAFAATNGSLMALIDSVPWESPEKHVAVFAANYAQIQKMIVLAGEEQSVLVKVFGRDSFVGTEFTRFSRAKELQKEIAISFREMASEALIKDYDALIASEASQTALAMRDKAFASSDYGAFAIDPNEWVAIQNTVIGSLAKLSESVAIGVSEGVVKLQEEANSAFVITALVTAITLLAAFFVGYMVLTNVRTSINKALDSARHIAAGDLTQELEVTGKDEVSDLLQALQKMRTQLKDRIEADAIIASENLRIKRALDNVSSAVTVSNNENTLIYMNMAANTLFKDMQSDWQEAFPEFEVDSLVGNKLSSYFPEGDFKAAYTTNLTNTKTIDGAIAGRNMQLVAGPVYDDDNNYQGRVTQWIDRTTELFEAELEKNRLVEERRLASETQRIKVALDQVSANVMLVDDSRKVIYLNQSAENLFVTLESQIQQDIPDFFANNLVGNSSDVLYTINGSGNREETEIDVGGCTLNVISNPVTLENGDVLGTAIEWTDRTLEVAVEHEIDDLVDSARKGDLSNRISLDGKGGFFYQLGDGFNSLLDELSDVFNQIDDVMGKMAQGDLNVQIEQNYQGTFGSVKDNINETLSRMGDVIGKIDSLASDVDTSADEISTGNNNLSSRTEQQASSLEETAASMEELTATVRNNAENSKQADQLAASARGAAEKGGDVVASAVVAMEQINKSSNEIAEIVGVIDEIAFQTNLLALNASVEAARAGEQGRGFAVVATEVRNLASRSADAAKEIKDLIRDSLQKVEAGSALVNESGETLEEIMNGVKKVGDIVAEISSASSEQAAGIDQVNQAVTEMDEMTQQNAALAEETSAASVSMSHHAREMIDLMGFFKSGDGAAVHIVKAAPVVATAKAAPAVVVSKRADTMPAVESNDDEWEEF